LLLWNIYDKIDLIYNLNLKNMWIENSIKESLVDLTEFGKEMKDNIFIKAKDLSWLDPFDWYDKLSKKDKEKFDDLNKKRIELEQDLNNLTTKEAILDLKDDYLLDKMSFNDRISLLEKDIDLLWRRIYKIKLEQANDKLNKRFTKINKLFSNEDNNSTNKDLLKIKAWEIYSLKQSWYDLARVFLNREKDDTEVTKINIKEWDKFEVNFWENKSLNWNIWAWDILPIDKVDKVKINDIEGIRWFNPRPWYYDKNWKYLSIFNNYTIKILSTKGLTENYKEKEKQKYDSAFKDRYEDIRKPEVLEMFNKQISDNWNNKELKLNWFSKLDLELLKWYLSIKLSKDILKDMDLDLDTWILKTRNKEIKDFIPKEKLLKGAEKYENIINNVINRHPQIWRDNLVNLINHENGKWDPTAWARWSDAYWLWQMTDSTWWNMRAKMDTKILWKPNRNNPEHQLETTCFYLEYIIKKQSCNIQEAVAYYNTWENFDRHSESYVSKLYIKWNLKSIVYSDSKYDWKKTEDIYWRMTKKEYFNAAVKYYNS